MYEKKYPDVDDLVMVNVKSIAEMGAYVSLLEYNNIEGMLRFSNFHETYSNTFFSFAIINLLWLFALF